MDYPTLYNSLFMVWSIFSWQVLDPLMSVMLHFDVTTYLSIVAAHIIPLKRILRNTLLHGQTKILQFRKALRRC